jgi:hypothetical protein
MTEDLLEVHADAIMSPPPATSNTTARDRQRAPAPPRYGGGMARGRGFDKPHPDALRVIFPQDG